MRILVLRPGAIGDSLLTFPVIQALKTHYDISHTTLVGNAVVLPLARSGGIADEVSSYETLQWSELFSTGGIQAPSLRSLLQGLDMAVCWLHDPDDIVERNLRAAGARRVTVAAGRPSPEERIHEVTYLARTVSIALDADTPFRLVIEPQSSQSRSFTHPTIALHPGSGGAYKCWPVSHFAAVITSLWQRNTSVLVLAGPADHERLADLRRQLASPPDPALLNFLVNAPLLEVAHQVRRCQGYLGNDSGITHLAALLGVPTLALFGPSDPAIWRPIGPSVRVLYHPTLQHLQPEEVLQEIEPFLL